VVLAFPGSPRSPKNPPPRLVGLSPISRAVFNTQLGSVFLEARPNSRCPLQNELLPPKILKLPTNAQCVYERSCMKIVELVTKDLRFPTSQDRSGSDAMNPDPDYSAAYVLIKTQEGLYGHGFTFTIGRGNELCVAAIEALAPKVLGRTLEEIVQDFSGFWRKLTRDSQLRWLGPEKGVIHLATAAIINGLWDLWAKVEGKPLWKLLVDLSPEALIKTIDFRYIQDVLSPEEALELLKSRWPGRAEREQEVLKNGIPAYTTSVGWLGYSDEKIRSLCRKALQEGWEAFKLKVGASLDDDRKRCRIVREEIGHRTLMLDANQVWEVEEAIEWVQALAEFQPLWIEEPTNPDDILGHARIAQALAPIKVAAGEQIHNRIMFKQFFQAQALGYCQIDAARLGGVNEVLAVLLIAAKFGVPVCPHAGGVGLCEYVQHLSIFDFIALGGPLEQRRVEYVDHLHEHFVNPVQISHGRYLAPSAPGYSSEIKADSIERFTFPYGSFWNKEARSWKD